MIMNTRNKLVETVARNFIATRPDLAQTIGLQGEASKIQTSDWSTSYAFVYSALNAEGLD